MTIIGDSDLVIKFMKRINKPAKHELVVKIDAAQLWVRRWKKTGGTVTFEHVPWKFNRWADWLGRVAARWK